MHELDKIIAQYFVVIPVLSIGVLWLLRPRADKVKLAIMVVLGAAIAYVMVKVSGHFFYHDRPFVYKHVQPWFSHGADNGFPSDHTTYSTLLAACAWPFNRVLGALLFAVAIAIGTSRVLAFVHSPLDIVGGVVFGIVAGAIAYPLSGCLTRLMLGSKKKTT
ncbi:MAG TPA: phosphatase PAP2 family protein [Candidatus Saccharimonadales bacterium]|nr:phosphatase PAP2 family protein [Candidatus Saccharimonadales bacterium]